MTCGIKIHAVLLVKCLALWGERERNGRHYSRPADCTALGTAAMSQSAFEQSNADRNRLDQECSASLGESWDRDPGALCWRLRSLGIFGLLFMTTRTDISWTRNKQLLIFKTS